MEAATSRRIDSALVETLRPFLRYADDVELAAVRAMCMQELSRRAGHPDSVHTQVERARVQIRLSLDEADLRKRVETGERLQLVNDYRLFKPDWGASQHEIYKLYAGFPAAMSDAGITCQPQPRRGLTTRPVSGVGGSRVKHTWESCLRDLAAMFEHNYGRAFTNDDYDEYALSRGGMATSLRVLLVAQREKGWKGRGTFQRVCQEALDAILTRWPELYPQTVAYLALVKVAQQECPD